MKIADSLEHRPYSSREFIWEMGKYLSKHASAQREREAKAKAGSRGFPARAKPSLKIKKDSLVQVAYEHNVPIFCPAFSDSSAGFGLVAHQWKNPKSHVSIDSVADFRELTMVKMKSKDSGLLMVGGGVPKNFAQDTVVCAEVLGYEAPVHKYAVQITVADVRDGACSSSTLKEASSWGKVSTVHEQMVFAEATLALPVIAANAYETGHWKNRKKWEFAKLFA